MADSVTTDKSVVVPSVPFKRGENEGNFVG